MQEENWQSREQRELDLRLENQSLETDITLQGGHLVKGGDIEPEIENAFLKNVLAFEEADKEPPIPMRALFPQEYEFPAASSMSREELSRKIGEIARILSMHNVEFGFANDLPDEVLYKYLVEECIPHDSVSATVSEGFTWYLDGCDCGCDECFQNQYCATTKELLEMDNDTTPLTE